MIKTWIDRVESKIFNTYEDVQPAMQAEIDELRAALQERDAEIDRVKAQEPVAYLNKRGFLTSTDALSTYQHGRLEQWEKAHYEPLYQAAGAQP